MWLAYATFAVAGQTKRECYALFSSYWLVFVILTCLCHTDFFVKMTKPLSYWLVFLLYWAQRSIHKFKVQSCALKAWIFRFVLTHSAQNDKGAPSLRAVFAKTAWQSKKSLWRLKAPSLAEGVGGGFKTHHTTFERACVPLLGWRKLHPFFMLKILCFKS